MHDTPTIRFKNNTKLDNVSEATYLGGVLDSNMNPDTEIQKRISATLPILKQMHVFRKQAKRPYLVRYKSIMR